MVSLPPSRPDLLQHYMSLDQGDRIQAECEKTCCCFYTYRCLLLFVAFRYLDRW